MVALPSGHVVPAHTAPGRAPSRTETSLVTTHQSAQHQLGVCNRGWVLEGQNTETYILVFSNKSNHAFWGIVFHVRAMSCKCACVF